MGVDRAIDITAKQRKIVTDLLERHLPDTAAWIYGSRVKWTARPQSDLDMVVFATPEQNGRVSDLREAFEESNLPFRVDLFVWAAVPEQFRKQIKSEHVVLVESGERDLVGEWPTDRFGRLLTEPVRNGIYKRKEFHGRGAKIVNMGELFAHPRLRAVPMKRLELSESENNRFLITAGDLLFARRSLVAEGAGKCCAVLNVDEPTTFESSIIRARPDPTRADYLYLYYFFNSALGLYHLDTIRRQVAVAGITGSDLANLDIPVPPLPEQRAIAHILGTLDDKIELNRRMNETLEAMARALFKSWFVDFDPVRAKMEGRDTGLPKHLADLFPDQLVDSELGEIPEEWKVGTLEDVASLNPESWSTRNAPEEIIYVDLSNTKWGYIEKVETYPWKAAPSRGRRVLRHGDTIVGTVRPGNGSFSLVGRDGLTGSTGFAVLRPKTPSDAELVWCAATSQDNIDRLAHLADGGAYPAVRPEAVAVTKFPLADFATRGAFSSVAASLLNEVDANKQQSHTLADLRDTLLPRLISGEWRAKQIEPESSISNISPDTTGVQA